MVDFERLLERTSRTFALAIPLLEEPTRRDVTLAYLLFRIADTFEDGATRSRSVRSETLADLTNILREPCARKAQSLADRWATWGPTENRDYDDLVAQLPAVLDAIGQREPAVGQAILANAIRTTDGMREFVAMGNDDSTLRLTTREQLRRYCYVVAGIVGEMLTSIFLARSVALTPWAGDLRGDARYFGEGLQLVNILKDAEDDAICGRFYLPEGIDRSQVFALAREDLERAKSYVTTLRQAAAPRGYVEFTTLPVELAYAALDAVERDGPGTKISRGAVSQIFRKMKAERLVNAIPAQSAEPTDQS